MSVQAYYLSMREGDKQLAPNFKVREFACKDGADIVPVSLELVRVLQEARDHFGVPITINSAYRTPDYNKKVGGAVNSQHMRGTAADITIKGVSPDRVYAYFCEKYPNLYGIGKYPTFTHIDVRDTKARW